MLDGSVKLIEISGGPGSGDGFEGFTTSLSVDLGETWTDFKKWIDGQATIVAMSSMIHVKENGKYIDKWFGTFHDFSYYNYKTYLTFDADGNEQWSEPEKMFG